MVKDPPAVLETWVRSLGWENPLEEGMATHSSILAWCATTIEPVLLNPGAATTEAHVSRAHAP